MIIEVAHHLVHHLTGVISSNNRDTEVSMGCECESLNGLL